MTTEEAKKAWREADERWQQLRRERDEAEDEALKPVRAKYDPLVAAARADMENASLTYANFAAADREAASLTSLPHPEGTIYEEWERRWPIKVSNQTGRLAILTIWRKDDPGYKPIGIFSRPQRGDIILRLLKKDGKPGLLITGMNNNNWKVKK